MKNIFTLQKLFLCFVFFISTISVVHAQNIVHIPDANFKAALLNNHIIDTDGDGEIQVTEAKSFRGSIIVWGKNISDLTGIEAFINCNNLDCGNNKLSSLDVSNNTFLTSLNCEYNKLTDLDVSMLDYLDEIYCDGNNLSNLDLSKNTTLTFLACASNNLSSLDLSKNKTLEYLYCENNNLTSLDVSENTSLAYLDCYNNNLSNLDVSKNLALKELWCFSNNLSSLDVSNNTALTFLNCSSNQLTSFNIQNGNNSIILARSDFSNNPNLTCIQVDDVDYANANFTNKDAWAEYSTDCDAITGVRSNFARITNIYPNPAVSLLTIETTEEIISKEVIGLDGLVKLEDSSSANTLDISTISSGVYFVRIKTQNGMYQDQFVKQ
jgi:Leucine-rich repeat (LRR) protein